MHVADFSAPRPFRASPVPSRKEMEARRVAPAPLAGGDRGERYVASSTLSASTLKERAIRAAAEPRRRLVGDEAAPTVAGA
jgi:hypothetical protein